MKNFLHPLIVLCLLSVSSFAQTTLFSDNFESYSTDQKLAEQASGTEWTTWSNTPGSNEDAAISTEQASEGTKSAKITTNNDLVLNLGDKTSGRYQASFDIFIDTDKSSFVGFIQDFAGSNTEFGLTLYFEADTGSLNAGGTRYEFPYNYATWMSINTVIDLDDDFATLYIDGNEIASWMWSKGSEGGSALKTLDGIDFWGYRESGGSGCTYYIDDVEYNQLTIKEAPSNLVSSFSNKIVSLSWDAPSVGIPIEYAIIRDGKVIAHTSSTSYNDNSLIYPNDYTYTVKAHYQDEGYSTSTNEISETLNGVTSQRHVLIEHFTNASCSPCASQNPILDALLNTGNNYSKVAHVAYHTSWPGTDPMYTFNNTDGLGNARVSYYKVGGVPNSVIGGNQFQGGPSSINQELIDAEYARPGLFNITASVTIDENDSIFIDIDYTSLADFNFGNLKVHTLLIEDLQYSSAPGSNGEIVFPDVMRYMYPDQNGEQAELPKVDDVIRVAIKGKLNPELKDKLQIISFIQDDNDKEVYMAYKFSEDFTQPLVTIKPANESINIECQDFVACP